MTAIEVLSEVRAAGGCLIPAGDKLRWRMPVEPPARLIESIRQRKADLLMLLAKPEGRCPAGHDPGYWQDAVGQWHCIECEPNPAWCYLRGVDLDVLGNRPITLEPPTGDLPAAGEWVAVPGGAIGEVVLYSADGAEVLVRGLKSERLKWFPAGGLVAEMDWDRRPE